MLNRRQANGLLAGGAPALKLARRCHRAVGDHTWARVNSPLFVQAEKALATSTEMLPRIASLSADFLLKEVNEVTRKKPFR